MNVSLDGFVEGPDEEVHRFHNQAARQMGAFLYARRMYETMDDGRLADPRFGSAPTGLCGGVWAHPYRHSYGQ